MNTKNIIIYLLIFFIILLSLSLYFNQKKSEKFSNKFNFEYDENKKLKIYDSCLFSGDGFSDDHEIGECSIAIQLIPHVKSVLEIGGGAGKVSHMINSILKKRNLENKHIVVEPGSIGVGNHKEKIYKNKEKFDDKYTIVKKLAEELTLSDLDLLDQKPECLYVDCEGCLHKFFKTKIGEHCLTHAKFVVNEQDSFVIKENQSDLHDILKKHNFNLIDYGYGCGKNCLTEVWYKD